MKVKKSGRFFIRYDKETFYLHLKEAEFIS